MEMGEEIGDGDGGGDRRWRLDGDYLRCWPMVLCFEKPFFYRRQRL